MFLSLSKRQPCRYYLAPILHCFQCFHLREYYNRFTIILQSRTIVLIL
nr:MAG TPA: hypothetical protein [Bacteriophage sp.]